MATTTTLRPEAAGLPEAASHPVIADRDLPAFRAGQPAEARLRDLLAFALAAETRQPPTPETIEKLRQEASAALGDHAFRYLHNAVDQIRREAVAEHLGKLRPPPGFGRLVLANLAALAIAALAAVALAGHPATLAGLAGLLPG
ncbi:hypothetical protein [Paracraurococcus ruber]|uniref:Uncharacterized protein n=1 Tax=Paracraurococcus ruber TaxID=77675 RepID=A0ABS1CTI9_9PROT|nr:hypothetical protein [Paracraurococcus ruber]MBK1657590.1 hypothetical protein [Paracraurococcus ruber]TDG30319.1 hypothetical protein E2C05_14785 [Paracraurococcus ruber]